MKIEVTFTQTAYIVADQLEASAKALAAAADKARGGFAKQAYSAVNYDLVNSALKNLETFASEAVGN